ncbi:MAG: S1 RNA-binding domain-containing protein [bacterium]|nr:S1 RNA-binding domain-containing protein [bacterium]
MPKKKQISQKKQDTTGENPPPLKSASKTIAKINSRDKSSSKAKTPSQPQTMAELLDQTGYTIHGLKRGDLVEGKITYLSPHEILIDVGSKSEGVVASRELPFISDLLKTLKMGDKVMVYVITPEDETGHVILSLRKASTDYKWKAVSDAKDEGKDIAVRGLEVNRGGLIVDYQGLRGFVPASQLEFSYSGRPQELVGQELQVRVLEVEQKNNRLIFSQKAAITKADEEKIQEKLAKIKIGENYEGIVSGITPFGLFVNLDGVEGLVHISEIAWEKITDPKDYFKTGDKVQVLILESDKNSGRLNLSIKQLTPDPYDKLSKSYTQEEVIRGKVVKLTNFGTFVKLKEGIEGLIHVSKLPPDRELKIGEEIECLIENIDSQRRKISLSLVLKEKPVGYK